MTTYDVIVAGGGPSGATTGFYAAKAGLNVAIIDRSSFPRDKACGGMLTARIFDELPELKPYIEPVIECSSNDVKLHSPSLKHQIDYEFPLYQPLNILREVFDHALLEAARDAGAEVLTETQVTGYQFNGGVKVATSRGDLRSKMVVGATGANDRLAGEVRQRRNLQPWNDREMGIALMWEPVVGKEFIDSVFGDTRTALLHFNPCGFEGFHWVFPKEDRLNIGFGGYKHSIKSVNVREVWKDYISLLKKDGYFPQEYPVPPVKGAPLPLAGPMKATTMDYTLIVGDAAGMVSPLSGEGIYYGMHAGKMAIKTINSALEAGNFTQAHLDAYHRDWNKIFGKELSDLAFFARMIYKMPETLTYYGTRDKKLCEMLADLFLGITPGGLGKKGPIIRTLFDAVRYPYFGLD